MHTARKAGINRNTVPENFTVGLALFDALPVFFFGIAVILLGVLLHSATFFLGALLCFAAGAAKVIWKLIVVLKQKNVWWLFVQMRYLMPIGFVLMITGVICQWGDPDFHYILRSACEFPVSVFLLIWLFCLILMGVFGAVLDSTKVRSNWIEQITNCVGQFSFLLGVILLTFSAEYYRADMTAMESLKSTSTVQVTVSENEVLFLPENSVNLGLIFYPGGNVEYTAYAPLLHNLAEEGITCVAVRMPLQLAIFDINAADYVMAEHQEISRWYIAGHSFGGAIASWYAHKNPDKLQGLILLAAYSTKSINNLKVLSVFGSEDGVMNRNAYDNSKVNLPEKTTELLIQGGNHAQFGSYGPQDGDGTATITPETQWKITCDAIVRCMLFSGS